MKDVQIVEHKDGKFHLVYQTQKAINALSLNQMDNVNFPSAAMPMIKNHLKDKKLTSVGLLEF
jgi:hypothetical protein